MKEGMSFSLNLFLGHVIALFPWSVMEPLKAYVFALCNELRWPTDGRAGVLPVQVRPWGPPFSFITSRTRQTEIVVYFMLLKSYKKVNFNFNKKF